MTRLEIDPEIRARLKQALLEDIGDGDLTTRSTVPAGMAARGRIYARQEGIFCGFDVLETIYSLLDSGLKITRLVKEGQEVHDGVLVAEVTGEARQILYGERVSLNLMGRMSGIATETRRMLQLVNRPDVQLLDTRKTMPLWRSLDKYAVRAGGGSNHRTGLYDMILIKENHIALAGGIAEAIEGAKAERPEGVLIEVEVRNLDELRESLEAGPDLVLIDNFSTAQMEEAVRLAGGKVKLEASGGVTEDTVWEIAQTGVDRISCGALTHSVKAFDLSMLVEKLEAY
jgi:nicotinate-nucleotide pyrophosphorylase (carboxylating)